MTIEQIESYYGNETGDWIRTKIVDGTINLPAIIRLKNPKYKRNFLKPSDAIKCVDSYILLPDNVRYSDVVRVEE